LTSSCGQNASLRLPVWEGSHWYPRRVADTDTKPAAEYSHDGGNFSVNRRLRLSRRKNPLLSVVSTSTATTARENSWSVYAPVGQWPLSNPWIPTVPFHPSASTRRRLYVVDLRGGSMLRPQVSTRAVIRQAPLPGASLSQATSTVVAFRCPAVDSAATKSPVSSLLAIIHVPSSNARWMKIGSFLV